MPKNKTMNIILSFRLDKDDDTRPYIMTKADNLLKQVYGDYIYKNNLGSHLTSSIAENKKWQSCWDSCIIKLFPLQYSLPDGHVSKPYYV